MTGHERAIVVGGSIAGLFAARVLADHYDRVVVLDRDTLDADPTQPRRNVPQGHHIHALLGRGKLILDDLFPGLVEELEATGVPVGDFGMTCHWYFGGQRIQITEAGIACVAAGRPRLEAAVRARVCNLPNVVVRDQVEVTGLLTDPGRVVGARLLPRGGGEEELLADLVVDASGRGSRLPTWLRAMGVDEPEVETVEMDLTYTTCDFEGPLDFDPIGDNIAIIPAATPDSPRGAIFARLPDRYAVSLTGILGDRPPRTHAEFLAFVESLPVPEIAKAVANARPLGEPHSFHFPASRRIRYDRVRNFPTGVLAVGDSFSAFNPVYAQGMTVAAMAAELLAEHLRAHLVPRPDRFHRQLARVVDVPWSLAAGADLGYAGVIGRRTPATRIGNAYITRLQGRAVTDPVLSRQFLRVAGLVDPPTALLRPGIMARTLLPSRSRADGSPAVA